MQHYWFKPKRYGLGAAPSSWQGWALTLAYIAAVTALGVWFGAGEDQIAERATPFIFITLTLTVIFVGIAWRTLKAAGAGVGAIRTNASPKVEGHSSLVLCGRMLPSLTLRACD